MSDRTRTGDHLDHNQELYQLSYAHQADLQSSGWREERKGSPLEGGISRRCGRGSSLKILSGLGRGAGLQQAAVDRQCNRVRWILTLMTSELSMPPLRLLSDLASGKREKARGRPSPRARSVQTSSQG